MAPDEPELKPTQIRAYYDALGTLKEQEQTALAELHAEDPQRLVGRFAHSVKTVAEYPAIEESFYGERSDTWMERATGVIDSTAAFAAEIAARDVHEVAGAPPELGFRYVDREIFPLRTTKRGGPRPARRSIDLLLASQDNSPIVGELKIGTDKPTYYALIQALMYAAELSSTSQRHRLAQHYNLKAEGGIDIYIIGYETPERGAFRARSFEATKMIASKLIDEPAVRGVIRRIAYLKATQVAGNRLAFIPSFSFA